MRKVKTPTDMTHGEIHKTRNSGFLFIVKYTKKNNVRVKFIDTGFECTSNAGNIRNGMVKDRLIPTVYGVGVVGDGKYKVSFNRTHTPAYKSWSRMLERCYSDRFQISRPSYVGCTVCDEWHNFQNFAEWFYDNHVDEHHLDKDIKIKGNRVYSPEACIFVSATDNSIESQAKTYRFLSPESEVIEIYNLDKFCKEHNLISSCMYQVSLGKRNNHKGWRALS